MMPLSSERQAYSCRDQTKNARKGIETLLERNLLRHILIPQ
jgi:hypothetical protein